MVRDVDVRIYYEDQYGRLIAETIKGSEIRKYLKKHGWLIVDNNRLYIVLKEDYIESKKLPAYLSLESAKELATPFMYVDIDRLPYIRRRRRK